MNIFKFTAYNFDLNDNWVQISIAISIVFGLLSLLAIFKSLFFSNDKVNHKPGYMSNKQTISIISLRDWIFVCAYLSLWAYIGFLSFKANSISKFIKTAHFFPAIPGILTVIFTILIIFFMLNAFRYLLRPAIYSLFILIPSIFVYQLRPFFSEYRILYAVTTLIIFIDLISVYLYNRFIDDSIKGISRISKTIASIYGDILKIFALASILFFFQIFIISSLAKDYSSLDTLDAFVVVLGLLWSAQIYSFFCKACVSSAVYLKLFSNENIFLISLKSTIISLPTIIYAAFMPAFLMMLYKAVDKLNGYIYKLDIKILIPIQIITTILKLILFIFTCLLEYYNNYTIPYIGIYGGYYNAKTSKLSGQIARPTAFDFLNFPKIKEFIFVPMAAIVTGISVYLSHFVTNSIVSSSAKSFFNFLFKIENIVDYGFVNSVFDFGFNSILIFFGIYIIFTFLSCLQSALFARSCYNADVSHINPYDWFQVDEKPLAAPHPLAI